MSTSTEFVDWIQKELNRRNWNQLDLAKRAGMSAAGISKLMSGDRKPGVDAIVGIARALNVPADDVLRHAGLLPPRGATAADMRQFDDLLAMLASLTPENQKLVFDLVERIKVSEENARSK